ncbi:ABC transporter permease [Kutzneria buriramensis]|uniref:ABC-2 type transport system permease protein n=1 Tax=Kutzneria buriramensis TaxID=1045776 RepID=A0A3E0HAJ7_9PSEU|nr:ABC transporter permease [Kutzneria buriramensis]REH41067.1 ABC-2 type transport system permease protein [Kutzneria buriramensis]
MTAFRSLSVAMFKGFFRERVALFFTFLMPLMFLVIFGLIFGSSSSNKTKIDVVGDGPVLTALNNTGIVDFQHVDSFDKAIAAVKNGDVPAAISVQGNKIELRYAASDRVQAGTVQAVISSVVDHVNLAASGKPPAVTLDSQQVEDSSLTAIQFLTPGILSWGLATSAIFGSALTLVNWRKKQVLRRIRLSPVSTGTVISSRLLVTIGTTVLQAILFIAVAMTPVFGLQLAGQWWLALPLLIIGSLSFFSIGVLVGSIAKSEEAATGITNVIVLPMAFLSGTFFPLQNAPQWLQTVSEVLPLRHLNDGMVDVLVRGKGVEALVTPTAVLLAFTVVVAFAASRFFSWEDS